MFILGIRIHRHFGPRLATTFSFEAGRRTAMEFVWCEFAKGREAGNVFAKSMNRLKLFPQASGGNVKFNWDEPGGRWAYDSGKRLMLIEFKSACHYQTTPNRRHLLQERSDGSFQLLPSAHEIYDDSAGIWTAGTVLHKNRNCIVMQKVAPPDVKTPDQ